MTLEAFTSVKFRKATLAMIALANTIIGEYQALGFILTLRQLFYQFVARALIDNTLKSYQLMGRTIVSARRAGVVDWDALEDRTRNVRTLPSWSDPGDRIRMASEIYYEDVWANQRFRPEVWIEKDALIGVIEGVCEEFRVPYFSCRGNVSDSEMYAAGKRFAAIIDQGQVPLVLHGGDHDSNGLDMTRDIRERLRMFARQDIEVRRFALNFDQTAGLPVNFAKESDSRFPAYERQFGTDCWELDALDPTVIAGLTRTELEGLIDADAWNLALVKEADNRAVLEDVAGRWSAVEEFLRSGS